MVSDFNPAHSVFSVNFPFNFFPEIILTKSPSNRNKYCVDQRFIFRLHKWQRVMTLTYDSHILFTVEFRSDFISFRDSLAFLPSGLKRPHRMSAYSL